MKQNFFRTVLSLSIAAAGLSASAATITQTRSVTANDQTMTFARFDSSLGTLTSVQIIYDMTFSGGTATVTFKKDAASGATLSGTFNYLVTGTLTPVSGAPTELSTSTQIYSYSKSISLVNDGSANSSYSWTGPTEPTSKSETFQVTSGASDFAGTGDYSVGYSAAFSAGSSALTGAGFETSTSSGTTGGSITIKYNYTAVPEPATGALALLGCGFLAARRRRHLV